MKKIFFILSLFSISYTSFGQLNDFTPPFKNSEKVEPSRSQFISFRRTSGTKGSPIDTALSYSPVKEWKITKNGQNSIAEANFVVPFDYTDKALFMSVGATNGAATLFINDNEVGHRSDSKLSSEFNISKFVERGLNRAKIVIGPEKGVEAIEQNGGLDVVIDEVYLFAQPKIRIFDITTKTSLDPTYKNGLLEIALLLKTELLNSHQVTVFYDLFDKHGALVKQESKDVTIDMRVQDTVRFTATIFNVEKWSHENPNLYTVEFRIKRDGIFTEYLWRKVGFRTVETIGTELLINGEPTKILGLNATAIPALVNRNSSGKEINQILQSLKYEGYNAIRTPFPLKSDLYDICDSLGFYLFETANINSTKSSKSIMKGGTLANNPAWKDIFIDRAVNTYERAKVYPSVIAVGLGSDAGNGYNMYKAYEAVKNRDKSRLVVYNDAKNEFNSDLNMFSFDEKTLQPTVLAYANDFSQLNKISGAFLTKQIDLTSNVKGVEIEAINAQKGIYKFTNNLKHTNLNQLACSYYLFNNAGKAVKGGNFTLDLAPGKSTEIEIPNAGGKSLIINIGKVATYSK